MTLRGVGRLRALRRRRGSPEPAGGSEPYISPLAIVWDAENEVVRVTWDEALTPVLREGVCGYFWETGGLAWVAVGLYCPGGDGTMELQGLAEGAGGQERFYYSGTEPRYPVSVTGRTPGPEARDWAWMP